MIIDRRQQTLLSLLLWLAIFFLENKTNFAQTTPNNQNCPAPALSRLKKHIVAAGETLESIANQYNLIPATLMGMNPELRQGQVRAGTEVIVPPYNGIRVEVPAQRTWRDVAEAYKIRPDLVYEINGCQENPRVVFLPGVNWSPAGNDVASGNPVLTGYPLPAVAPVIFGFGWRVHPLTGKVIFHSGLDLQATPGTPVLTAGDGTVAFAGQRDGYGNLIVINHQEGLQTRYAHLETIKVSTGQKIKQGMQLGTVGSTGNPDTKTPHLHFEVRYNSDLGWVAEDPTPYIQVANGQNNRVFSTQNSP